MSSAGAPSGDPGAIAVVVARPATRDAPSRRVGGGLGPWLVGALGLGLVLAGVVVNEWTVGALLRPGVGIRNPIVRVALLVLELAAIAGGAMLYRRRRHIRARDIAYSALILAAMLLGLEVAMRFVLRGGQERTLELSTTFGWLPRAGVSQVMYTPLDGPVRYSTTRGGFRRFGDVHTSKTRILVIGDSFTQAIGVADGATYYDYLAAQRPDVEVFAFGAAAYGSLQEYQVLDRYLDVIRPDLVLWQLCANDVVNNDHALETASLINNNAMWRPYYEAGRIRRRYPSRIGLVGHSYLLRYLELQWRGFRAVRLGEASVEFSLTPEHPTLARALRTTDEIMGLVRRRAGAIPVVAFTVDRAEWVGDAFERLARRHDIHFAGGVPEAIEAAKADGVVVDGSPRDAHWNARGHAIAGRTLLDYLSRSGLLAADAAAAGGGAAR